MSEFGSPYKALDRKINTWCRYTKRLDPYGRGCSHDCKYCYARGLLNFRNNWNPNEPSKANLYKIKCAIRNLQTGDVVRIGGMTDDFQPLELVERLTYKTILWLNHYHIQYLIVTKSSIVSNEEYLNIYDKKLAHFQISITSTSDKTGFTYEKASSMSSRIKSLEKISCLGFDSCLRLSPLIEGNIDFDVLNRIKCEKILIEFLKVNHWIEKNYKIDYSQYTLKSGGFRHLPLQTKINIVNRITGFNQVTVGEYVKEHHEYFSKNVNFNPLDCCNLTNNRVLQKTKQLTLFP